MGKKANCAIYMAVKVPLQVRKGKVQSYSSWNRQHFIRRGAANNEQEREFYHTHVRLGQSR